MTEYIPVANRMAKEIKETPKRDPGSDTPLMLGTAGLACSADMVV